MHDPSHSHAPDLHVSEPMRRFIEYFGELGPRWGVRSETSRAHALLYLVGRPMVRDEVAQGLEISKAKATTALKDLIGCGMAQRGNDGRWRAGSEPWDLLFAALESRRQREIAPALEILRQCDTDAKSDPATPHGIRRRITGVRALVENLAAIDAQSRWLPRRLMPRLIHATGTASRLIERITAHTPPTRRSSDG